MNNLKEKVRSCFLEQVEIESPRVMNLRAAKLRADSPDDGDMPVETRVRDWVKSTLATAPWLALAIILFGVFVQGSIVGAALGYGLLKVAVAVVGTVIADKTMFQGQKECSASGWVPMIRRAMVFMGICWLMSVT